MGKSSFDNVPDYFELFELSPDASRAGNLAELTKIRASIPNIGSAKGMLLQGLCKEAIEIFGKEDRYRAYRSRLDEQRKRRPEGKNSESAAELAALQRLLHKAQRDADRLRQELEEAKEQPEEQRSGSGGGLLGLVSKVANAYIKAQQAASTQENLKPIPSPPRPHSLGGAWITPIGLLVQIFQQGNRLSFYATNRFGMKVAEGFGEVIGNEARLQFRYFDGIYSDEAQTTLQISADGRRMEGLVYYARAGVQPGLLVRQM
jgi:hypothetical protein